MNFDEEIDRLRSVAEGLPDNKDLEATIKWMILDLAQFIRLPVARHAESCSDGLTSYQDQWVRFHGKGTR